jgi:hypothetical protein
LHGIGDSLFEAEKSWPREKKMIEIEAIALPTEVAEQVWETMKSRGYGHPAFTAVAKGHGPCRHCLKPFRIGGEERTLFTYNPFREPNMIPAPGPVFIHTDRCERFAQASGYPAELLPYGAVIEGYGTEQQILERRKVYDGTQEAVIRGMFENASVRYVMVRDLKAGCFDLRVVRKGEAS